MKVKRNLNTDTSLLKTLWFVAINIYCVTCFSQDLEYGLVFKGQNFKLDDRTQLNLTKNTSFNFKNNFELSFDLKFNKETNKNKLYGYVFRIINDNNNNIDLLISDIQKVKDFVVVDSDKESTFPEANRVELNKWYHIKINISIPNNSLSVSVNNKKLKKKTSFKSLNNLQFLFGANDVKGYITRDVPDMTLKNIKIFEENILKYDFPLFQCGGNSTKDKIKGIVAGIKNESWELCNHSMWKKDFSTKEKGVLLSTMNEETGELFLLSNRSLLKYTSNNIDFEKYDFANKNYKITLDHRIFYNKQDKKLYCYLIDTQQISAFDLKTKKWDNESIFFNTKTTSLYQHHTGIYSAKNNSLYVFGGYGQFTYKNCLFKLDLTSRTWSEINTILKPKYLSGGAISDNNMYIFGGYGSESGKQQINPRSYYDLVKFDINNDSLNKVFNTVPFFNEMIVGNNIIIDQKNNDFYALASEKSEFKGNLKLIKGNLNTSKVVLFKDSIPYRFQDTKTYFNLYFNKKDKKLTACVSYSNDSKETEFSIYTIDYPPSDISRFFQPKKRVKTNYYFEITIFLLLVLAGFFIKSRLNNKQVSENETTEKEINNQTKKQIYRTEFQILFFGGFQIFDVSGKNITGKFSPLLKELFLLIYLYTYKDDKGISSEKLKEILWFDKTDRKAQNNRAVNTTKLKRILEEVGELTISKETGYWRIKNSTTTEYNDYSYINNSILSNKPNKQDVKQLISIIKKGAFLNNLEYQWLDRFRRVITDSIIDYLTNYVLKFHKENDLNLLIEISQCLFNFDSVNEISLFLKCKVYNIKGNHKLVDETYKKFSAEYKILYAQKFEYTLKDILDKNLDSLLY